MSDFSSHRFDGKGFWFFIKTILIVLVVVLVALSVKEAIVDNEIVPISSPQPISTLKKSEPVPEPAPTPPPPVFVPKTITEMVPATGKFIGIDLKKKILVTYSNHLKVAEYPIVSIGNEGVRGETPEGSYRVHNKEKSHFSTINNVYLPYSMQFSGSFFIHGHPTYPNGSLVPVTYKGGSIRLATENAQKVFSFANIKTPIYVYTPKMGEATKNTAGNATDALLKQTTAEAYLIGDADSGNIILESNSEAIFPIASVSKLTTALVASEVFPSDKKIVVTEQAIATEGESGGLRAGETFTAGELLYPLLLESSNDSAVAYAESMGFNQYIDLLNAKAKTIGMYHTQYQDPSGLDPRNVSNATDLFTLASYYLHTQPLLLSITKTKENSVATTTDHDAHIWKNTNGFINRESFLGGKTGRTDEAKESMVSLFHIFWDGQFRNIAVIVLRSDDRLSDSTRLLQWLDKVSFPI